MKYQAILADPPWNFKSYSKKGEGRSAKNHYKVMEQDDLFDMPITVLAANDCVLFLWVTDPMLAEGLRLIGRWGFTYKTVAFYWVKQNKQNSGYFAGLGYWTRSNPEQCLLATKGKPKRVNKDVRRLIVSPRREHSRKPDKIYTSIERLVSGPYMELFSRTDRKGWDSWGNQTGKWKV